MIICNCKDEFEGMCKKNYIFGDLNCDDTEELISYPFLYFLYYHKYKDNNIISELKNDKLLFKYLVNNDILTDENICYYQISYKLLFDEYKNNDRKRIECLKALMDYLYWSYGNPYDENNFLRVNIRKVKKVKEEIKLNIVKDKYKDGKVKLRTGQQQYRKDLINIYSRCQICGLENKDLLIASHIKEYSKSENDEAIDFNNGLLLCPIHDKLFDKGLISFEDSGRIIISMKLSSKDRSILGDLNNVKIEIKDEQKKYLKWHRENVFKKVF